MMLRSVLIEIPSKDERPFTLVTREPTRTLPNHLITKQWRIDDPDYGERDIRNSENTYQEIDRLRKFRDNWT